MTGPLDSLPTWGTRLLSNPKALWVERWLPWIQAGTAVVGLAGIAAGSGVGTAGAVALNLAALAYLALGQMRHTCNASVSQALGLRAVLLARLDPREAERVYRIRLPPGVRAVAELHVVPWRRWRAPGEEPRAAARRFLEALHADYDWVAHELLPESPGWAFCVSTWHRVPEWLGSEAAVVLGGPRPSWLAPLGERHRAKAQRRMFGALTGAPVGSASRWRSYVVLPEGVVERDR